MGLALVAIIGGLVVLGGGGYAAIKVFGTKAAALPEPEKETASASGPTIDRPTAQSRQGTTSPGKPQSQPTLDQPQIVAKPAQQLPVGQVAEFPRPSHSPKAVPPAEEKKFTPETLRQMDVPERKNLSNLTMSEAIQLADKDPRRAVEGLLNAISANPTNPSAYAWAIAILYENGRYSEIPPIFAKARQNGISRAQMASNIRFRMAMQREALNRSIPGGHGGGE
jgi:hypothetical protein